MSARTNMLKQTSPILSLRTFFFLETCLYPTVGKKTREKDVAAGCGTSYRTEAQLALAADLLEFYQDPR